MQWICGELFASGTGLYENRREPLPSGLGTIGIQATADLSEPARIGPFEDTQAVEAWVLANVAAWTRGNDGVEFGTLFEDLNAPSDSRAAP